ncbi:MAG TPA: hypothetical protein VIZ58_02885, partial [Thermoanaerobaculia bacterium]
MGRRNLSTKAIRDFAPVLIPLMTKVVVPMAMRNLQRSKSEVGDAFDDARGRFEKTVKRSRSDFDDVRDEAVDRGKKLYGEAVKHGTELLEMLAARGVGVAEEWADAIRPKKKGFPW